MVTSASVGDDASSVDNLTRILDSVTPIARGGGGGIRRGTTEPPPISETVGAQQDITSVNSSSYVNVRGVYIDREQDGVDVVSQSQTSFGAARQVNFEPSAHLAVSLQSVLKGESTVNRSTQVSLLSYISTVGKNNKQYRLFEAPMNNNDMDQLCLQAVGQGSEFYIRANCNKNHHCQEVITIITG